MILLSSHSDVHFCSSKLPLSFIPFLWHLYLSLKRPTQDKLLKFKLYVSLFPEIPYQSLAYRRVQYLLLEWTINIEDNARICKQCYSLNLVFLFWIESMTEVVTRWKNETIRRWSEKQMVSGIWDGRAENVDSHKEKDPISFPWFPWLPRFQFECNLVSSLSQNLLYMCIRAITCKNL
jgi:hypothetical protein